MTLYLSLKFVFQPDITNKHTMAKNLNLQEAALFSCYIVRTNFTYCLLFILIYVVCFPRRS